MTPSKKILVLVGIAALAAGSFAAGNLARGGEATDSLDIDPLPVCGTATTPPCAGIDAGGPEGTTDPVEAVDSTEGTESVTPVEEPDVAPAPITVIVTQPEQGGGSLPQPEQPAPQPSNPQPQPEPQQPAPQQPAPQPEPQNPAPQPQPEPEKPQVDDKLVLVAAPKVTSSNPAQDAIGVALKPKISITFSQKMDQDSAEDAFSITAPAGYNNGAFSWDATGKVLSFMPSSGFDHGATVQWKVAKSAKSAIGEKPVAMTADASGSFRVLRIKTETLISQASFDGMVYSPAVDVQGSHAIASGASFNAGTWQRGFLSFDLSGLPDDIKLFKAATLSVYQTSHKAGAYGPGTGKLLADSITYGSLDASDYAKSAHQFCWGICGPLHVELSAVATDGWKEANVLVLVGNDWKERATRGEQSQFRLRFEDENEGAGPDISAAFASGSAAQKRPTLEVIYEYP